jgi:hypothetical protein
MTNIIHWKIFGKYILEINPSKPVGSSNEASRTTGKVPIGIDIACVAIDTGYFKLKISTSFLYT